MNKLLLAILLLFSTINFAQDTSNHVRWEDTSATKKALESTQRFLDSMKNDATYGQMERNMESLLNYQKEQSAKQKKRAFLYIGLGLFFLVIMIVGLLKRTKSNPAK